MASLTIKVVCLALLCISLNKAEEITDLVEDCGKFDSILYSFSLYLYFHLREYVQSSFAIGYFVDE